MHAPLDESIRPRGRRWLLAVGLSAAAGMPSLDRLQAQLGGGDFQVVALSVDAGAKALDRVKSFYASEGIKHLAVYLDADAAAIFTLKAGGVPTTLLLDRQGRELGRMSGTAEWDSPQIVKALQALLGAQAK